MKVKGIKRGQSIELSSVINIPDGTELLLEIDDRQLLSLEERRARIQSWLNQSLEGQADLLEALEEVERERRLQSELALLNIDGIENTFSEPLTSIIGTGKGSFATPEEADRFIREERDAWDS
jgi:hypothetical protein